MGNSYNEQCYARSQYLLFELVLFKYSFCLTVLHLLLSRKSTEAPPILCASDM